MDAQVVCVASSREYSFSKLPKEHIHLLTGLGVDGDVHAGMTVKHRSRVAQDPSQPNLRQVHLIHAELFDELQGKGFSVKPGDLGENITTRGIDLLGLPERTLLLLGETAVVEVTGLRNPCRQIEEFSPGLLAEVLERDDAGNTIRKTGVMGIVLHDGLVFPGDPIRVTLPDLPHRALDRV